jgi:hypothetical protein
MAVIKRATVPALPTFKDAVAVCILHELPFTDIVESTDEELIENPKAFKASTIARVSSLKRAL